MLEEAREPDRDHPLSKTSIVVVGAGIIGLWQAYVLARSGHRVRLIEESPEPFARSSSRRAGAMIAPECEAEAAPPVVRDLGREGLALWRETYPGLIVNGTLVVAQARDAAELMRYGRMTEQHEVIDAARLAKLEPDLAGRFERALYFQSEGHFDAMAAMTWLLGEVRARGADVDFGQAWQHCGEDVTVDCRGMAARGDLPKLRGVRGERVLIETRDIKLSRPVRLLHPRQPIYVVPQGDGRFVVGASVIEREDDGPMTLKSALDLLASAYALNPAFGEASILDLGAGVRPAFPDNVPRIAVEGDGRVIRVNGAYRHGFLLAPVLAQAVARYLSDGLSKGPFFDRP
jgi:glycine oxidase